MYVLPICQIPLANKIFSHSSLSMKVSLHSRVNRLAPPIASPSWPLRLYIPPPKSAHSLAPAAAPVGERAGAVLALLSPAALHLQRARLLAQDVLPAGRRVRAHRAAAANLGGRRARSLLLETLGHPQRAARGWLPTGLLWHR